MNQYIEDLTFHQRRLEKANLLCEYSSYFTMSCKQNHNKMLQNIVCILIENKSLQESAYYKKLQKFCEDKMSKEGLTLSQMISTINQFIQELPISEEEQKIIEQEIAFYNTYFEGKQSKKEYQKQINNELIKINKLLFIDNYHDILYRNQSIKDENGMNVIMHLYELLTSQESLENSFFYQDFMENVKNQQNTHQPNTGSIIGLFSTIRQFITKLNDYNLLEIFNKLANEYMIYLNSQPYSQFKSEKGYCKTINQGIY